MLFYDGKIICDIFRRIVRIKYENHCVKCRFDIYNRILHFHFFGNLAFISRHVIYFYGVNKVVSQLWTNMWQSKKICSIPIQYFCVNRRFEISNLDLQFPFISTCLSKIHDMFYIFGGKRSCLLKLCFYLTFSEELFEFNRHLLCWLFIWNIESNYTIQFF